MGIGRQNEVGAAVAAVAHGAMVIEKDCALARADGGVNSTFSLEPHELAPWSNPKASVLERRISFWSWDITFLASRIRGQFYRLYMVKDIFSRKIVGWEAQPEESWEHASVLISKACLAEGVSRGRLVLYAANGGPMKWATMPATLQRLGVVPSFRRPSVSDDNPYSESLFRTLKYRPTYPRNPLKSIEAARGWVYDFVLWYNHEHRHSVIQYATPAQRHGGIYEALLQQRTKLYGSAKAKHPRRRSGPIRNWKRPTKSG